MAELGIEEKFAVLSPILGTREDVPSVILAKAYSPESENVHLRDNEAQRMRGRLKECLETEYDTGTIAVTNGSPTVTGSGTSWYSAATHYPAWGSDDAQSGRVITIASVDYTIKSVNSATQLTLTANYAGSTDTGLDYVIGTEGQKVQAPDGNPIIRYHQHIDASATEYFFGRTKNHIYLWSSVWSAWVDKTLAGGFSDATSVDIVSVNNRVLMTDGVNKLVYWADTSTGDLFDYIGSASGIDLGGSTYLTAAKYMTLYDGYVMLAFTTEGGTVYPYRVTWCSLRDDTDWDQTGSGDAGHKDFIGKWRLKGFGLYQSRGANQLIAFKERGPAKVMWVVEADTVFETDDLDSPGLLATHSVVNDSDGNCYYIGADYTARKVHQTDPISDAVAKTLRGIPATYVDEIESGFWATYNQVVWSIPSTADSTTNDKLLSYDVGLQIWHPHSFVVRAFGLFSRQVAWTIDTIPYTTIDGIQWEHIDAVENIIGFLLDVGSDYSGYTFDLHSAEKDNTADYTGKLVLSTDCAHKKALTWFKRAGNLQFIFRAEGTNDFTVSPYAKAETDASWQALDEISLNGSGEFVYVDVPCDVRFHVCQLKMEATNRFSFVGVIFDFEWDGDN